MKNKIEDLRNHLFEMLEQVKDKDTDVDLDRMRLGTDIAQTIINSAKVEVDFLKVAGGGKGSGFIPEEPKTLPSAGQPGAQPRAAGRG
ncbi:hypothetical protein [Tahibacter harae]|uniref:Uncharacterized protein n=1 Tax=Tahibacter harae TaxID=2963937 RepID=A0ABT1QS70_9GAMM|nr:hypothetical protein [Tahibacter harae]MCQ4165102.1 hypothetical protein [Tahibacter harae]